MAEENSQQTEQTQAPETILPSEQAEVKTFEQFLEENKSENGKLYGRFDTPEQALQYFREQEITHTNKMREIKNEQKEQEQTQQEREAQQQQEQQRMATINELVPEFMQNNMELTDDMAAKLEEGGISRSEIELGAYKVRDAVSKAHSVVGGKENYESMMAWAGETLDDATKAAFDNDISALIEGKSGVSALAIEGLYGRYQAAQQSGEQPSRISGNTQTVPERGYKTQAEMLADKRAVERSGDPAARQRYQAKLGMTPDSVIFGH